VKQREIRFVLNRPKRSENIGAAARALANTGAGELWLVAPRAWDQEVAAKVATRGARHVLDAMRVVDTLDEALAGCIDVVMTSGRSLRGALHPSQAAQRLVLAPGPVGLVFGDEQNGLDNLTLRRASVGCQCFWRAARTSHALRASANLRPTAPGAAGCSSG